MQRRGQQPLVSPGLRVDSALKMREAYMRWLVGPGAAVVHSALLGAAEPAAAAAVAARFPAARLGGTSLDSIAAARFVG